MKTYMCDICGGFVSDPCRRIYMREVFYKKKNEKPEKIHLCNECWCQIAKVSREKRNGKND